MSEVEDLWLALASQFFDAGWYLARYPDVAAAGLDPLTHFPRFGIAEGRATAVTPHVHITSVRLNEEAG